MKSAASNSLKPAGIGIGYADPLSAGSAPVRLLEFKVPLKDEAVTTPVKFAPIPVISATAILGSVNPVEFPLKVPRMMSHLQYLSYHKW